MWITSGVGYNVAEIRAAHAGRAGRQLAHAVRSGGGVEIPGLRRLDPRCAVRGGGHGAALPRQESEQQLARGSARPRRRCCMAIRPYVRYVDSSRYIDNLANGDICLAMGWSGDVKQAHDRAAEAGKGVDLAYTHPAGGRDRAITTCWRSRRMRRTCSNAHLFINYLLRPDVAARTPISSSTPNGVMPDIQPLDAGGAQRSGRLSAAAVRARLMPERAAAAGVPAAADAHVDALQDRQMSDTYTMNAIQRACTVPASLDPASAYVRIANVTKNFGDFVGGRRRVARHPARRDLLPAGRLRARARRRCCACWRASRRPSAGQHPDRRRRT